MLDFVEGFVLYFFVFLYKLQNLTKINRGDECEGEVEP